MGITAQSPDDAQNAAFLHKDSAFKILKTGIATLTTDTSGVQVFTVTIPHNLGFTPLPQVFMDEGDSAGSTNILPYFVPYGFTTGASVNLFAMSEVHLAFCDKTNLYIQGFFRSGILGTVLTYHYRYYLLEIITKV